MDFAAFVNVGIKHNMAQVVVKHPKNTSNKNIVELQRHSVQPTPIRLGTKTQMEAFMKDWWKQSALHNAQPCTLFPANQKRAVAERRAVAKAATSPLPLLPPFLFPVYYRQRSHGRGKSNHFCTGTNARICTSITKPVWSPESSGQTRGSAFMDFCPAAKVVLNREDLSWSFWSHLLWTNGIVFANTCASMKFTLRFWVSECLASWCAGLWGGLRITRVGAEVRPRTDVREECAE